ncbi:MAG: ISL3 family transposase [Sutterella seckii]
MATFDTLSLFTAALMLPEPWYIEKVEFPEESNKARALHLYIKFRKGARFPDPAAVGSTLTHPVYDTQSRIWRHMNFFQYQCYLHCEVPRITGGDGKVRQVSVPWARPGSGFTLLFEALMLMMSQSAPVASCAKQCEVTDNRLWRIIQHYVEAARAEVDLSGVTAIGIDETSKKGTDYVTVFADLETGSVINVQDGKDSSTVDKFALDFAAHGGLSEAVTAVTSDMSLAFDRGIKISLPNAEVIIDKFHVVKNCNDALDQVRRRESKTEGVLEITVPLAEEFPESQQGTTNQADGSLAVEFADRQSLPNAPQPAEHLSELRDQRGCRAQTQGVLQLADARPHSRDEAGGKDDPQPLGRDSELLDVPPHQCAAGRAQQHHSEHQAPSTRI